MAAEQSTAARSVRRKIRVAIAEDDQQMSEAVSAEIQASEDLLLGPVYSSAQQCMADSDVLQCDVLLLDFELPDGNALEVIRQLRQRCSDRRPRILIFTAFEHEERLLFALEAGADGYLLKDTPLDLLLAEIQSVHLGASPIAPRLARAVLARFMGAGAAAGESPLTAAETRVLKLLALGMTYAEAARKLGISTHTLKNHVERIYRKLEVRARSAAIEKGRQLGIVV